MAGTVGSIRAEATLDISKFKSAAAQMGAEGAKIASSLDKASTGLNKAKLSLDNLNNGLNAAQAQLASANAAFNVSAKTLDDMKNSATAAAEQAAALGKAYEQAKSSFGETSLQAHMAQQEYSAAASASRELEAAVDSQQQKVNKSSAALEKASASVKKYKNSIASTKSQIAGLENQIADLNSQLLAVGTSGATGTKSSIENMLRATITSSGESLGTFAMRAAGVDTTSFLGILGSRGISRGIIALGKALPAVGLGILGVGAAAGVAGYAIYKAAEKGANGIELWQKAYEGVDQERTTQFTQIVEAGIKLEDTGITDQVNSVYEQISKALTDGKPDTATVISEISGSAQGMFTEVRQRIQTWYDLEMTKLDLSTPAGIQKAEELTNEYHTLIDGVNELDENTAGFIASYAGKSTAECEDALTQLETYETELERLVGRAAELTTILQSNQAAAFTTVTSGITTDETTVANATAYVQFSYSTKLRYAEEDHEAEMAALWQEYQTKLQTATSEQGRMLVEADYEIKLQQATESYTATKSQLAQEYTKMISDVMQGVAEAASRSNPELAQAIQSAISGDFSKLNDLKLDDPALSAAMKGFVESGVLDGITNADLSTAEGQLEAMIRLLAQGTGEYADAAFEKLGVRETKGIAGVVGAMFGSGAAIEAENPAQRIAEFADQTSAALQKLAETGSYADINNVQELFRTAFDYDTGDITGEVFKGVQNATSGLERLVSFMDAVSVAATSGNLDTAALEKYSAIMGDIMAVLNSMQQTGGAENLAFLAELSSVLNSLGYSTDYYTVVSTLNEIWAAWQPFASAEMAETVTLTPEIQVNEKGVPMPTPEQLRQMGYFDFLQGADGEPVQIQVPAEVETWPILEEPVEIPVDGKLVFSTEGITLPSPEELEQMAQAQQQEPIQTKHDLELKPKNVTLPSPEELEQMAQAGAAATDAYAEGLGETSAVSAAGSAVSAAATTSMSSGASGTASIGLNFSQGLAAGIRSGRSGVISAAASVARAAAAAAKSALDIHSPSGVTFDYGEFFDLGLIKGIEHLQPDIDDAVRDALYLEPPSRVAYADQNSVSAAPSAAVAIDYDRLAQALSAVQIPMYVNDRKVSESMAASNARAQNSRNQSIARGYYGITGKRR